MRILTLLAAVLVGVIGFAPVAGAESASEPSFTLAPADGSPTAPDGGWFQIATTPSTQAAQAVAIRNHGTTDLEILLAPVDATTGSLGGVSYALPEAERTRAGRWITLDADAVSVAAGETVEVPFTVDVPQDAPEGVSLAGIAAWVPEQSTGDAPAAAGQAGASVVVQTRRVVAVQFDLPGAVAPVLNITGIAPVARPDGLYLEMGIENEGTGLTTAQGTITLSDGSLSREFAIDTFVPGTAIAYPIRWADEAENGSYDAEVTLTYGVHRTRWAGNFAVGDALQDELADRALLVDSGDRMIRIALVAPVTLAVVLLLVFAIVMARRLRGRPRSTGTRYPVESTQSVGRRKPASNGHASATTPASLGSWSTPRPPARRGK